MRNAGPWTQNSLPDPPSDTSLTESSGGSRLVRTAKWQGVSKCTLRIDGVRRSTQYTRAQLAQEQKLRSCFDRQTFVNMPTDLNLDRCMFAARDVLKEHGSANFSVAANLAIRFVWSK